MPAIPFSISSSIVMHRNLVSDKRILVNRGGTRSTKTYSLMQLAANWLMTGIIEEGMEPDERGVLSVVRKTRPSLKASAFRDFEEILYDAGVMRLITHNKTELTFTFGERMVEFFSVDNQQKVRSRKRNHLICIEANELDFRSEFNQLLFRTSGKIFMDFNPDDEDIWINRELEEKRAATKGDVEVIVSTYKDNPFLEESLIKEIEYLEKADPELWAVYGEGKYGKIEGVIYTPPELIDQFPETDFDEIIYGLDFGFQHPTALVKIAIDHQHKNIYLQQIYYKSRELISDLIDCMKEEGIGRHDPIYADPARPGLIQEIENEGFLIKKALKGPDSVSSGIRRMKTWKWHVVASSQDILRERRKYRWMKDKNGDFVEGKPVKLNDDAMDAIRYGLITHTDKGGTLNIGVN